MRFWPFRARDPIATELGETVVGRVSEMQFALRELAKQIELISDAEKFIRGVEQRVLTLERTVKKVEGVRDDDMARISASIDQIRGLATGPRGGRPRNDQREAAEVGRTVMEAMQDPAKLQSFIVELQRLAHSNGLTETTQSLNPFASQIHGR